MIDDSALDMWIATMADHVLAGPWHPDPASKARRSSDDACKDMTCALLRLPLHLRSRVLSTCLKVKRAKPVQTLATLLATLPHAFHRDLIACEVANGRGALNVADTSQHTLFPFLAAAATKMQPPGLLNLSVTVSPAAPSHPGRPDSRVTAALVADALTYHSTLTHLSFISEEPSGLPKAF